MSRQTRTLLIVGLLALAGVSALAFLADRYSGMMSSGDGVDEATVAAVDGFVATRRAVIAALDAEPLLTAELAEELSGKARNAASRMHYKLLVDVRIAREETLAEIGMTAEEYDRIRESFASWMGFKFAEKPAEPELVAEFERRREELEPLYLELMETVDQ